jgi:hypothetical protein
MIMVDIASVYSSYFFYYYIGLVMYINHLFMIDATS